MLIAVTLCALWVSAARADDATPPATVPAAPATRTMLESEAPTGLQPDEQVKTIVLPLDVAKAQTSFVLHNSGAEAVVIKKIGTLSGGLSASSAENTVAAGQETTLSVALKAEPEAGEFTKAVFVWLEGFERPLILSVQVKRPPIVTVDSKVVEWRTGDKPDPKVIKISAVQPSTQIMQVTSNDPNVAVDIEPASEGSYSVAISCPGTRVAFSGSTELTITGEVKIDGKTTTMVQHVRVEVWVRLAM